MVQVESKYGTQVGEAERRVLGPDSSSQSPATRCTGVDARKLIPRYGLAKDAEVERRDMRSHDLPG